MRVVTAARESVTDRLRRVLEAVERDQLAYSWVRRQVADPDVGADEITAVLRDLGWRQSFRCRSDGRPRHYWRDWAPRPAPRAPLADTPEARAAHSGLGAYRRGESHDVTLQRAALERVVWTQATLAELGDFVRGELRTKTLRRAALTREARIMWASASLAELGPYVRGEPLVKTRRRAALTRADRTMWESATLEQCGSFVRGEPRTKTLRRAALAPKPTPTRKRAPVPRVNPHARIPVQVYVSKRQLTRASYRRI